MLHGAVSPPRAVRSEHVLDLGTTALFLHIINVVIHVMSYNIYLYSFDTFRYIVQYYIMNDLIYAVLKCMFPWRTTCPLR